MSSETLRDGSKEATQSIVIISAACCIPGMAPLDEQARRVVEQAVAETGVAARVTIMPATTAYFGGVPKEVMARLMSASQSGRLGVPAVLIDGRAVSYGVPTVAQIAAALLASTNAKTAQTDLKEEGK